MRLLIPFQVSRDRPLERCGECGNVVKLNYIGPDEDPHAREFDPPVYAIYILANQSQ